MEICRICCSKIAVSQRNFRMIFNSESLKADFPRRLSNLLDLPVSRSDGFSEMYVGLAQERPTLLRLLGPLLDRTIRFKASRNRSPPIQLFVSQLDRLLERDPRTPGHRSLFTCTQSRLVLWLLKRITVGTAKRLAFAPVERGRHICKYL